MAKAEGTVGPKAAEAEVGVGAEVGAEVGMEAGVEVGVEVGVGGEVEVGWVFWGFSFFPFSQNSKRKWGSIGGRGH
jgi:hypothetical protein